MYVYTALLAWHEMFQLVCQIISWLLLRFAATLRGADLNQKSRKLQNLGTNLRRWGIFLLDIITFDSPESLDDLGGEIWDVQDVQFKKG